MDGQQLPTRKDATNAVHCPPVDCSSRPISIPIFTATTFELRDCAHGADLCGDKKEKGAQPFLYSRWGSPTNTAVQEHIAKIENGFRSLLFGSGMAAISTTLLSFLKSGDHVVAPHSVYGGTHLLYEEILKDLGIQVTLIAKTDISAFEAAIQPNTKVLYAETPSNPHLVLTDLEALAKLAKARNLVTICDSTFASPYNQKTLDLGIDVSIHSGTKYLGGHSDVLCGVVTTKIEEHFHRIWKKQRILGGVCSPMDAFLLERGIKSLVARVQVHNLNALTLARYLEKHPKIGTVFYPGLESHPQYALAQKQMKNGSGGMIAFEVKGGLEAGKLFVESLKLITLAVSLGGVESLIEHAATMTHQEVPREERLKVGITDGLLRFSVGIEDVHDLIADIEQSLGKIEISTP